MTNKEKFKILADKMDKRHKFLYMLYNQFPKYEDCPDKWKLDWKAFEADGFKCWRDVPKVVKKIKRASRKRVDKK